MRYCLVFFHGWGFDHKFFKFFIHEYFSHTSCHCLDLGYFGEEMLDLPSQDDLSQSDNIFIGIGHSLGLIKLASLNIEFKALIGIQAFTNFLGFDSQLQKKRKLELSTMIKHFRMNPIDTLTSFHKLCGINHNFSSHFNKAKLMQDLQLLTTIHQLPDVPLLILGAVRACPQTKKGVVFVI